MGDRVIVYIRKPQRIDKLSSMNINSADAQVQFARRCRRLAADLLTKVVRCEKIGEDRDEHECREDRPADEPFEPDTA